MQITVALCVLALRGHSEYRLHTSGSIAYRQETSIEYHNTRALLRPQLRGLVLMTVRIPGILSGVELAAESSELLAERSGGIDSRLVFLTCRAPYPLLS